MIGPNADNDMKQRTFHTLLLRMHIVVIIWENSLPVTHKFKCMQPFHY